MQCGDVRDLLDSFLSEELLVETTHEILRHIERCPTCGGELEARRGLRATVRTAISRSEDLRPRPEFIQSLSADLQAMALRPSSVWAGRRPWLAVAAAVTLVVAIGFAVQMQVNASALVALARDAAGDHIDCAEQSRLADRPVSLEEAGPQYDARFGALGNFRPLTSLPGGAVEILDRHACMFRGRLFAHLVFRYRGELVSLLVPSHDAEIGRLARAEAGRDSTLTLPDGIHVAWFVPPGHVAFVVSRLSEDDTRDVAHALAEPVSRLLAAIPGGTSKWSVAEMFAGSVFRGSLYCWFSSAGSVSTHTGARGGTS